MCQSGFLDDFLDNELASWQRLVREGHPVREDWIVALRRTIRLKKAGVDAVLDEPVPDGYGQTVDEWREQLDVPNGH